MCASTSPVDLQRAFSCIAAQFLPAINPHQSPHSQVNILFMPRLFSIIRLSCFHAIIYHAHHLFYLLSGIRQRVIPHSSPQNNNHMTCCSSFAAAAHHARILFFSPLPTHAQDRCISSRSCLFRMPQLQLTCDEGTPAIVTSQYQLHRGANAAQLAYQAYQKLYSECAIKRI
jgi:hypothetical protein